MIKSLETLALRDAKIYKPNQKTLTVYSCDYEVTEAQSLEKGVSFVYNFMVRCFYNYHYPHQNCLRDYRIKAFRKRL